MRLKTTLSQEVPQRAKGIRIANLERLNLELFRRASSCCTGIGRAGLRDQLLGDVVVAQLHRAPQVGRKHSLRLQLLAILTIVFVLG